MKPFVANNMPLTILIVFLALAFQLLCSWIFVRFVHYDAQYRSLQPDTYEARIITPEDYALLRDTHTESVTLSDGTTFADRQPSFYQHVLPNYKRVGNHYLLVTTLGTSHYYYRWITDMMPFMVITAIGLVAAAINYRRRNRGKISLTAAVDHPDRHR